MNYKILVSLSTIVLASSALGYGTFAAFSDVEESTGNLFEVGTLDLTRGTTDLAFDVGPDNLAPGDSVEGAILLRNSGSILDGDGEGHSVVLDLGTTVSINDDKGVQGDEDNGGDSTHDPLPNHLKVINLTYGTTWNNLLNSDALSGARADGTVNLSELDGVAFTDLADPGSTGTTLTIGLEFLSEPGQNHLKRDVATLGLQFTLRQVVG